MGQYKCGIKFSQSAEHMRKLLRDSERCLLGQYDSECGHTYPNSPLLRRCPNIRLWLCFYSICRERVGASILVWGVYEWTKCSRSMFKTAVPDMYICWTIMLIEKEDDIILFSNRVEDLWTIYNVVNYPILDTCLLLDLCLQRKMFHRLCWKKAKIHNLRCSLLLQIQGYAHRARLTYTMWETLGNAPLHPPFGKTVLPILPQHSLTQEKHDLMFLIYVSRCVLRTRSDIYET